MKERVSTGDIRYWSSPIQNLLRMTRRMYKKKRLKRKRKRKNHEFETSYVSPALMFPDLGSENL